MWILNAHSLPGLAARTRACVSANLKRLIMTAAVGVGMLSLCQCSTVTSGRSSKVVVSVKEQKLALYRNGKLIRKYPVSTSKFGVGDRPGSYCTPLGTMKVAKKIGTKAPRGAVFKSRRRTGEILKPNAPGRDPIVSRIIWLAGTESRNRHAYKRFIYIHGTAEERKIGQVASYGCIRMRSRDVINLYKKITTGTEVEVVHGHLPNSMFQPTIAAVAVAVAPPSTLKPVDKSPSIPVPQPPARGKRLPELVLISRNGGSSWATPASTTVR